MVLLGEAGSYYKIKQNSYYEVITKGNRSLLHYAFRYYKVWQLLQSDMYHRHEKVDKTRLFEFLTKFFILVKVGCFAFGSSNQRCSLEKAVLKNFAIFTGKQLVFESLFNKVAGLQVTKCIKKTLQYRCFRINIAKFLGTRTLKNICEWLLLRLTCHKSLTMNNLIWTWII